MKMFVSGLCLILPVILCIFAAKKTHHRRKPISDRNSADSEVQEQLSSDESHPNWERIYVFRSNSNVRGPPKPAEQMSASRARFLQNLIRLEKLSQRVTAAIEGFKICYRKYGYNLDECMHTIDQFNEHVNDTYDIIRTILRTSPNEISQLELDKAMKGVDSELRRQAFDELGKNSSRLSTPVPCCGIELETLRKVLQGSHKYASAECNSDAGKMARRKMLRQARRFRKGKDIREGKNEEEIKQEVQNKINYIDGDN